MTTPPTPGEDPPEETPLALLLLTLASIVGGAAVGLVGAAFRAALAWAGHARTEWITQTQAFPAFGWLLPIGLAAIAAAIARYCVRFAPLAAGSGIQHVEAVMRGEAVTASWRVIPVKFFGGLLSMGAAGLALGREGPTVQMGATIGSEIARHWRLATDQLRALQASLAGAGLAVAFNAPIGGVLFALEEISRSFRIRILLPTLFGCASAITVSRSLLGDQPDFPIQPTAYPLEIPALVLFLLLGLLMGLLGILYNQLTVAGLTLCERFTQWPPEAKAALVGGAVGFVGWWMPSWIGGGEELTAAMLIGTIPIGSLALLLLVRWFLGPLSYAAGTPGGLFAPLLLIGAAVGILAAHTLDPFLPASWHLHPTACAVVAMSAFFTAVVRAPLTGIVLISEMTGTTLYLLPMLIANGAALALTSALGAPPIYDTLRARLLTNPTFRLHKPG